MAVIAEMALKAPAAVAAPSQAELLEEVTSSLGGSPGGGGGGAPICRRLHLWKWCHDK